MLDTVFIQALLNRRDQYHEQAMARRLRYSVLTGLSHGEELAGAVAEDLGEIGLGRVRRQGVEDASRGELHGVLVAVDVPAGT